MRRPMLRACAALVTLCLAVSLGTTSASALLPDPPTAGADQGARPASGQTASTTRPGPGTDAESAQTRTPGTGPEEPAAGDAAGPELRPISKARVRTARTDVELPRPARGATALRLLGTEVDEAAAVNTMATDDLVSLLSTDSTAWLDTDARLFYVEPTLDVPAGEPVAKALAPLDQTFALHSKPGAKRTIFLDFDGAAVSGSRWHVDASGNPIVGVPTTQPAWYPSRAGGTGSGGFAAADLTAFQQVWESVAEDYAPFDIDVTTADPGPAGINRSGAGDDVYGARVVVTPDAAMRSYACQGVSCGGVAYLDVFGGAYGAGGDGYGYYQPAWVFPQAVGNAAKGVAEAASHEAGHQLGLEHDGTPAAGADYYQGHGAWAPIMGVGYYHPISQWSKGDYAGADNQQDDVAVLRAKTGLRVDEAGSTLATSAAVPTGTAYISSRTDTDVYRLGYCTGSVTVSASPLVQAANLDIGLTLLSAAGTTVTQADPPSGQVSVTEANGLNASITRSVASSTYYYVVVDGVGNGAWDVGYDDYGSLGAYTLAASGCNGAAPAGVPSAPTSTSATPHPSAATVSVTWAAPSSAGASSVVGYELTRSGDDTPVQVGAGTTSYTWTGLAPSTSYTFTVTALNGNGPGPAATTTATTTTGMVAPTAPRGVTASWDSLGQQAVVTWIPPADSGTHSVYEYAIYFDGVLLGAVPSTRSGATISGATPGPHTIAVAARSAAGLSPQASASVTVPPRAANDAFAARATLPGVSGSVDGDNTESSAEATESAPRGTRPDPGKASVWYSWTAPASGPVTMTTTSAVAGRDTILSVYQGSAVNGLFRIADNDEPAGGGHLASVQFDAYAGQTYVVAVDGYRTFAGGVGPFTLTWSGTPTGVKETSTALAVTTSGRSATLTATVSTSFGAPAGTVEFMRGDTYLGYGFVSGQTVTASYTATDLTKGEHTFWARFWPNDTSSYAYSRSVDRAVTIAATATTTTLQVAADQQTVTLTAAVTAAAGTAAGTVQFREGSTLVGTATVSGGAATLAVPDVEPGPHTYTATFMPTDDRRYDGSTSAGAAVTVPPLPPAKPTTTTLTGAVTDRTATLTATVSATAATPSGRVQFTDGGTVVATADLVDGAATVAVGDLTRGAHDFRATFLPANAVKFEASQSAITTLAVAATPTVTDLAVSVEGRGVTLRATVTPAVAGTVEVREGASLVGTLLLEDGEGRLMLTDVPVGEHTYTASFVPADDLRHAPSGSPSRTATVLRTETATVLGSTVSFHAVTLTATVTAAGGTVAGSVTFREGSTVVGTAPVASGTASVRVTDVATGAHTYTATFAPADAGSFHGSTSAEHTAVVTATPTTTDLVVGVQDRAVTLSGSVSAAEGTPAGVLEFREGGSVVASAEVADGEASATLTDVGPGSHTYTATFVPDGTTHAGSTSPARTITVKVDTQTTLSSAVEGRAVTLTAVVSGPGAPAGSVQFRDGASLVGTVALAAGTASLRLEGVLPGGHSYTATFVPSAPATYAGSVSDAVLVDVDRVATTTGLVASVSGRDVTLTATVTATSGAITGSVTFRDGTTVLSSRTVNGATATLTLTNVAHGNHSYTATFVPTGTVHNGSTSAAQAATVLGSTTTTLTATVSARSVALTATVATDGTSPVGSMYFYRSGTAVAIVPVSAGTATYTLTNQSPGDYTYSARFTPTSGAHAMSTSEPVVATVAKVATTSALTASASGRTVTLDAVVAVGEGGVGGQVRFQEGEAVVGTVNVGSSGAARLVLSDVAPGEHAYTATFLPSASSFYAGSVSPERSVTVDRVATTTALTAVAAGRTVTLTATPTTSWGTLTGSVVFFEGDQELATRAYESAPVVLTLTSVDPGPHSYTATFVPTGTTHTGSTSPGRTATAAPYTTLTRLQATVAGRSVTLDAEVEGEHGTPQGRVVLRDGSTVLDTVALTDGAARLALTMVTPGEHSYTATFVPTEPGTYSGSVSAVRTATVDPIETTTDLTATHDGDQVVTLSATVQGTSGTPTGTVEFREGVVVVGTATVSAGTAAVTLRGVAPGEHTYRATYVPASTVTFTGSASATRTVTVDPITTRTALTATVSAAGEGDGVLLQASVDVGAAGRVVFREGSTVLDTVVVASRAAELSLGGVEPGTHTYTATFVPTDPATYAGSVSAERSAVVKVPTTTELAAAVFGRTVTLDAEVSGVGSPPGEVRFREGGVLVGTVAVSGGAASLSLPGISPGEHRYTARFVPTATETVRESVSAERGVTVDPFATTTTLETEVDGRTVAFAIEVAAASGTPAGTVVLRKDEEVIGALKLTGGAADVTLTGIVPGEHAYTASFEPADPVTYAPSVGTATVTVAAIATTTLVGADVDGRTVRIHVVVDSTYDIARGSVEVREGDEVVGSATLGDGAAEVELTGVAPGEHTYEVRYLPADPAIHVGSTASATVTVAAIATATSLDADVDVRDVRLTAEVSAPGATPAGEVVFREGATELGTVQLTDGTAALDLADVEPGEHAYTATFVPTSTVTFSPSVSAERRVTVEPIVTTTALRANADVRTVILEATVTGASGMPAGDVVFADGDTEVGYASLDDGEATFTLSGVEPGAHSYTARFVAADVVRFAASVSPVQELTVAPIVTSTDLSAVVDVRTVTLTAGVTGASGQPDGHVVFREDGADVGTAEVRLELEAATLELRGVTPGEHTYTATFVPDDAVRFARSTSAARTVEVAPIVTTTVLEPTAVGRTVTLAVTVTGESGAPTGQVVLRAGDDEIATRPLVDGRASLEIEDVEPGEQTYAADFVPADPATYAASSSGDQTVTVSRLATTTSLTATAAERTVTLVATVGSAHGAPGGAVDFLDADGNHLDTASVADGVARLSLRGQAPGERRYQAVFRPTGSRYAESSAERTVTVSGDPVRTAVDLEVTVDGRSVYLVARTSSSEGSPAGDLEIYDGDTPIISWPMRAGESTFDWPEDRARLGTHHYSARFVPADGATFAPSTSAVRTVVVRGVATTTTVATAVDGRSVELSATVGSAAGVPYGYVTYFVGGTALGEEYWTDVETGAAAGPTHVATSGGRHVYRAVFTPTGWSNDYESSEGAAEVLMAAEPTTTSLTATRAGRDVVLTAGVAADRGVPAGTVVFRDGAEVVATETVVDGTATARIVSVPTGRHDYTADYVSDADARHAASQGTATLTLAASPTSTALAVRSARTTVTFTATVTSPDGQPGGTVRILEGDAVVVEAEVVDGVASVQVPGVVPGEHTYRASYLPADDSYLASTSEERSITVVDADPAATTTTDLTADAVRRTVTLRASVTASTGSPVGMVQFSEDGVVVDAVPLTAGAATLVRPAVAAGARTYQATFVPANAALFEESVSPARPLTIAATVTTTTATGSISGTTAVLDVTVSGRDDIVPIGSVEVLEGGGVVATAVVVEGRASVVLAGVAVGAHSYTVRFVPGTADQSGSQAAAVTLTVAPPPAPPVVPAAPPATPAVPSTPTPPTTPATPAQVASTTTLTVPKSAKAGSRPKVTVTVKRGAAAAAGPVVLAVGGKKVTLTLKNGKATYQLPKVKKGTLTIAVVYAGDATTKGSSASKKLKVK